MLSRYSVGDRVNNPSDHADLAALLAIYDSALTTGEPTKAGCGVCHFEKRWDMDHPGNTTCFFVVRTDGTSIDFSTIKALDAATSKAS
ncbi:DCL family protein [Delftia tsuruhatensis]|uniref:DCL family protein n=1 Tax=Delftia tsuruhatensis TaxID=180282 RepID=UPI003BA8B26F